MHTYTNRHHMNSYLFINIETNVGRTKKNQGGVTDIKHILEIDLALY